MGPSNEKDLEIFPQPLEVRWLRVPNVPEPYSRVALFNDDLYFQLEVFGLTRADLVTWFVEHETGTAFVTATGKIFLSSRTTITMLEASKHPDTENFAALVDKLYQQALSIYYPIKPINEEQL